VSIELTPAVALVLFEFLSRFSNEDVLRLEDQAEERVLWDLCASLESVLVEPFAENYKELLERARVGVRDPVQESH
jgi:hypothetical protein